MPVIGRKRKGWTLPGYNFVGPFNELNNEPVNELDQCAKNHDVEYYVIQKKLKSIVHPYIFHNPADTNLIDCIAKITNKGPLEKFVSGTFELKKALAPASSDSDSSYTPADQIQDPGLGTSNAQAMNPPVMEDVQQLAAPATAAGGGGGGQGSGGGGGAANNGMDLSAGDVWSDDGVVTQQYRKCVLNWCNPDKQYTITEFDAKSVVGGTTKLFYCHTGWHALDVNSYGLHFTPFGLQKLVNHCKAFKPVGIEFKIGNINFYEETTVGGETTTTSTVVGNLQVYFDAGQFLPWQSGFGQNCPEHVWQPWEPHHYDYFIPTVNNEPSHYHNVFIVEHMPGVRTLRAGDQVVFTHKCKGNFKYMTKGIQPWYGHGWNVVPRATDLFNNTPKILNRGGLLGSATAGPSTRHVDLLSNYQSDTKEYAGTAHVGVTEATDDLAWGNIEHATNRNWNHPIPKYTTYTTDPFSQMNGMATRGAVVVETGVNSSWPIWDRPPNGMKTPFGDVYGTWNETPCPQLLVKHSAKPISKDSFINSICTFDIEWKVLWETIPNEYVGIYNAISDYDNLDNGGFDHRGIKPKTNIWLNNGRRQQN